MSLPVRIRKLVEKGALFFCSHSGGKDSQAMYLYLVDKIPHDQIVVVHADLGEVEWEGVQEHIKLNLFNHQLNIVKAIWKDGTEKNFVDMVLKRHQDRPDTAAWPSSGQRYCTSDLKRDPISKFLKAECKRRGAKIALNCLGIRAEESTSRSKKRPFKPCKRNTTKTRSRVVYEWLPIFKWSTAEVFQKIADGGQEPHWAYERNERLSCVFCIFGSDNDLQHGAERRPDLARKLIGIEKVTGSTMYPQQSLADRINLVEVPA